jgi:hypothetical protein
MKDRLLGFISFAADEKARGKQGVLCDADDANRSS